MGQLPFQDILQRVPLFAGMAGQEISELLGCLSAREKQYHKNEAIFLAGERVTTVGIVLEGAVQVVKEDFLGNRTILAKLAAGELFAEAFSCAGVERLPVSVFAVTPCTVLMIDYRRIITTCTSACSFHGRLIENMLGILAGKNVLLSQKIEVLSRRATRDKLIAFLSAQAQQAGRRTFTIPFNRQELADYLCVDRSAMSSELGRLRDEGILEFDRSSFRLLAENPQ